MEEEEKPKKKRHSDFSGMKKKVKKGPSKQPPKKYGPFSFQGRLKPGMSQYQKKTMNEFMKVKEGETLAQWQRRTQNRRVKGIDEIELQVRNTKLRIKQRSRERNSLASKNKYLVVQSVVREFDFMRFYGIVVNYYSIKYGIRKEDIEIGFYFYTNVPFTRSRFNNAMVLHTGNCNGKVYRWIKDGLIEEIIKTERLKNGNKKLHRTHLYKLEKHFVNKLTVIYRTLGKMNTIQLNHPVFTMLNTEIKQLIVEMNDEIQDIQSGRKPQSK